MSKKVIVVDGERWTVRPLAEESQRRHAGGDWHLVRVRFDPDSGAGRSPRATWLRCEHDIPTHDVIAQYDEEQLVEAFLAAEELQI
ncbi:MAG: hypothetical protein ACREKI_09485 [Gemmatimonadota bacterium]